MSRMNAIAEPSNFSDFSVFIAFQRLVGDSEFVKPWLSVDLPCFRTDAFSPRPAETQIIVRRMNDDIKMQTECSSQ